MVVFRLFFYLNEWWFLDYFFYLNEWWFGLVIFICLMMVVFRLFFFFLFMMNFI